MDEEIIPLVASFAAFEFPRILSEMGKSLKPPPAVKFAELLALMFVTPRNGRPVARNVFSADSDLIDLASVALSAQRKPAFELVTEGTYQCAAGDGFAASRVLMIDEIKSLRLRGEPVAVVPHRDLLMVTGADDLGGLRHLITAAEGAFEVRVPICARPLVLRGRRWEPLELPLDHPLYRKVNSLCYRERHALYGVQRELLVNLFKYKREDVYVAHFEFGRDANFIASSFCTWTGVVEANGISSELLLPLTDMIQIIKVEGKTSHQVVRLMPRAIVEEVCAEILEPTDFYPARWRTKRFPSEKMIRELTARATS